MEWPTEVQVTFFKPRVQEQSFAPIKQLQAEGIIATSASITKLLSPD